MVFFWRISLCLAVVATVVAASPAAADDRNPFFAYVTGDNPRMICYTPSELDPRNPANQRNLATRSIRSDLAALRPAFDGLVLYGYHEACTPRVLEVARDLEFRAVLLAIWDVKSADEIDGVVELAKLYHEELAIGVIVGNEGVTFKRYEVEDLLIAGKRARKKLPDSVPITTSEPHVGYKIAEVRDFGDFLAPNIHPVFDRESLAAAAAADWAREQALALAVVTKKPVLLKETGFPHDGKFAYSPQTQRDFWQAYVKPGVLAKVEGSDKAYAFHGVAFEAFDLPWKSEESKLEIEKSWGLLSRERKPYPAFDVWRTLAK